MIAWILVGIFASTTALLFYACHLLLRERAKVSAIVDETMAMLKSDRDSMLKTALEARGVQHIESDRRQIIVQPPPRKGIGAKILALEKRDREEAERREAERRASMDRDERVGLEESEALRLAEQKRRELSGADA